MEGSEEGFFARTLGRFVGSRFVRGWSVWRAKIAFVVSTLIYTCLVLYTHFFKWPISFMEGLAFVTGASTLTSIIAFFSKHIPEFDFD